MHLFILVGFVLLELMAKIILNQMMNSDIESESGRSISSFTVTYQC
jgi:hypothetical protein